MEDLASPVGEFIRECCKVESNASIETKELYRQWRQWCEDHGRDRPGTEQSFGRDLRAVVPSVTTRRPKQNGERWREYVGIRLRRFDEPDAVGPSGSAESAIPCITAHTDSLSIAALSTTRKKPKPGIENIADLADPEVLPLDRLFNDRRSGMLPD
jgi:phage/plasmid-associated DNA primase